MSRPPHARENVLDAFERILIDEGERAATIEAIARNAGVSKGGLLYHFASKEALERALYDRASALAAADAADISAAQEGPIAYFLRSSVLAGNDMDRALVAVSRLAQGGHADAVAALRGVREKWANALRPHTRDETALALVMLMSDGLYYNNVLGTQTVPGMATADDTLRAVVALAEEVAAATPPATSVKTP